MSSFKYVDVVIVLLVLVAVIAVGWFYYFYAFSVILISIGLLFTFCKRFKNRSLLADLFDWIGSNLLVPKNRFNHIIWGMVCVLLGIFFLLKGDSSKYKEIPFDDTSVPGFENWWYKDPLLYIVIILLIVIGVYRSKQRK